MQAFVFGGGSHGVSLSILHPLNAAHLRLVRRQRRRRQMPQTHPTNLIQLRRFAPQIAVKPFIMVAQLVNDAGFGERLPQPAQELPRQIQFILQGRLLWVLFEARNAEEIAHIAV